MDYRRCTINCAFIFADQKNELNCSKFNALRPAEAINKIDGHQAIAMHIDQFTRNDEETQKIISQADIIIVERNYFGDALTIMQFWKSRGKSIIACFDDAYDLMHPKNVAYPFWHDGIISYRNEKGEEFTAVANPKPLDQFTWGLRMVKGIQVPSVMLAKDWEKYAPTYYVPNYLEIDKYLDVKPLYPHNDIIIGWCGSMSHLASFTDSGASRALKKIARKYDNVKILIGGDKRVYDSIDLREGKKLFQPYVPEEQFLPLIKSFDIGLAPLVGRYDMRRSHIKVLEYMALQMPWVASDMITYSHLREYGIMTENTIDAWVDNLSYAIEHLDERREYAKGAPFDFAMSMSYDNNIQNTLALYQKIIDTPYPGYIPNPLTD